jgi:arylesterase / paraoxonase
MSRTKWTPAVDIRNQARSGQETDFFAVVDTSASPLSPTSYKKIKISNLPTEDPKWRGLNLVGLDVVESTTEPDVLWVYVINHRPPFAPATAERDGSDPAIEIFRTKIGSDTFEYVRTVEDPQHIITPNDVVGKPDGSGFWVSNDHGARVGLVSTILPFFRKVLTFWY